MTPSARVTVVSAVAVAGCLAALAPLGAQDRLSAMPGYQQFRKIQDAAVAGAPVVSGALTVNWAADGQSFTYATRGKAYRFDLATRQAVETGDAPAAGAGGGRGRAAGGGRGQGTPPVPPVAGQGQGRQGQTPPARGRGQGGRSGGMEQAQTELPDEPVMGCPNAQVARGRQRDCEISRDQKRKAFYRARNFWVANLDGSGEKRITTDGDLQKRIKNGSGSWVYGEELNQTTAIWWSPDSAKVGFYRFDESQVQDFYLQMSQTAVQSQLDVEAYPKAGAPNPIAEIFIYDVTTGRTTQVDIRDGKPFSNDVVGHYAYNVRWTPDGAELLLNRTNRRQNILELAACAPATGKCRVVIRESWPTGWLENSPTMRYLADNKRFIWESERNGFSNYYLYDLTGRLINPITTNTTFESGAIVKLDEAAGVMFYLARDGETYMKMQLHRVGLDGKGDVRLTDPKFNHSVAACGGGAGGGRGGGGGAPAGPGGTATNSCGISPDNKFFVDVYQTHDQPAATRLVDMTGKTVADLASADVTRFTELGMKKVEMFSYKAADGQTTLYGTIAFPSAFDASKKYPTLIPVYGGPASGSNVPTENFTMPNIFTEYGFLVVSLSSRAAPGMGKRTLDSIYMKLGITEMADMAEGIKALQSRPYFDRTRVGMFGTSYGGYTSALMILKYPDLVTAAASSSPVTSWHHYDSIYTERYMWIPQENEDGYAGGNAMAYAKNLKGRLLLYYGTADNNVHPNNAMQLIRALQTARCAGASGADVPCPKSFEIQVGPDAGHSGVNANRMMEFFIENLVMRPERLMAPGGA
jgi:dipeptidyl-peptidase-4